MAELLMTIPGCGEICAWTIRAYTDGIQRFTNAKKHTAFAGLVPWVPNSNETVPHGKITKRGPEELQTALVQAVMGIQRCKKQAHGWRLMQRYEATKRGKGPGRP
jgi:transposase